jgi:glycosyltransferase involved in cell wall biosynthesis
MLQKMVSVIMPCYNQGAYIQEAIDSVLAQTYTNCEIVIVNDGSTDEATIQKLHKLEEEGFNVITIANSGVSAARNIGIEVAKGEYILPLDADDRIAAAYVEEAIKILIEKPEVKLVYCDCEYFGTVTGLSTVPRFSIEGMLFENLIFNSAIIRKDDFKQSGGYDEAFLAGWEDWEFWLRFIHANEQVYKLPNTYFYYRIKNDSRNSAIKDEKRALCEQQLYKKHFDLFLKINSKPITLLNEVEFYKNQQTQLETYREQLRTSISYRLGNFLLKPLKLIFK